MITLSGLQVLEKVGKQNIKEIILATSLTTSGQTTAHYIVSKLKGIKVEQFGLSTINLWLGYVKHPKNLPYFELRTTRGCPCGHCGC